MMKNKKLLFGILAIAIVAIAGVSLVVLNCGINDFSVCAAADIEITPLPPAWQLMTESVFLWENDTEQFVAGENSDLSNFLFQTLHRLNLQAKCAFSEEDIHEIKENDRVIEMRFRHPEQITISQWIEPYQSNVKYDENGYRILENVKSPLFILEDNLDEGLEAHVLIDSFEGWSCWAIQQEESDELDKTWIDEINRLMDKKFQKSKPVISANSTVFEGERWMVIFDDGKVTCYSDHYYPDHKEIVIKEGYIPKEEVNALLELFSNLSEYSDYTVNVSDQLIRDHMDCVFDPIGGGTKISCIPLNKTLRLKVRPPTFPEPETATPAAKEILERIDKIYREAEIPEKKKEINPYCISLNLEPSAESYHVNQMIIFNASLEDGWLGNVSSYEWDFGDGSKGYGEVVRHAYASEGNYTVKLTVITSDGAVGVKCKTMNVTRSAPSALVPGFEAVFTIAVLLAVAYLRKRK
ncbi:MAG: PKD domain-containing protein [Methanophagales archaeon]|nr:PKD domain-containing protein [Methanophagales archaeon]